MVRGSFFRSEAFMLVQTTIPNDVTEHLSSYHWKKVELCNSLFERWEETRFSIFPLGTIGKVGPLSGWRDTSDEIHTQDIRNHFTPSGGG